MLLDVLFNQLGDRDTDLSCRVKQAMVDPEEQRVRVAWAVLMTLIRSVAAD